ncbi:hypothetical protein [Pseudomonas sp. HN2-3]|uniref:hypothetical protein n=1 Tax=Pseudomonas sp. HN2-3 TaxID=2886360 RepID=UPI001D111318|nr:hypothetical protein [Pseudomonas sp. HN2-3]UDU83186.1 hypothetical protein LJX93_09660 [Pseudomonas sp. HN2-3]
MPSLLSKRPEFAVDAIPVAQGAPSEVIRAQSIDWNVPVDAFLVDAARAGRRYAALVYGDRSGMNQDGMTIATPPLEYVEAKSGFKLMRSVSGEDYYVITSELNI